MPGRRDFSGAWCICRTSPLTTFALSRPGMRGHLSPLAQGLQRHQLELANAKALPFTRDRSQLPSTCSLAQVS